MSYNLLYLFEPCMCKAKTERNSVVKGNICGKKSGLYNNLFLGNKILNTHTFEGLF